MNEKSLFSAGIRILGIYSVARGFNDLLYVFLYVAGTLDVSVTKPFPTSDAIYGWVFFLAGLYMIRGAPLLVKYAFPAARFSNADASSANSSDEEMNDD